MRFSRRFVITRALVRETVPTLLLATGVTTFLLVIRQLFLIADLFISREVRPLAALQLVALPLPNILALTVPIGMLFAVLMTAARISGDSELVALQACGVPLRRVVRPLFVLALAVSAASFAMTWWVMPRTNRVFSETSRRIAFSAAKALIQPKVFVEDFPTKLVYVDRIDQASGRWHGILLFDRSDPLEERLVVAETGEMGADSTSGSAFMKLNDTVTHVLRPDDPAKYQQNGVREQIVWLTAGTFAANQTHTYGVRETPGWELLARAADDERSEPERREAVFEVNKRMAIPAAATVFALLGFPLGVRNKRSGKGFGLAISVGLVVAYYILLNIGDSLANNGRVPVALGAWIPNLVLGGLGVWLLWRAHQVGSAQPAVAKTIAGWWVAVRARVRPRRDDREREASAGAALSRGTAVASHASRGPWFIGILDRYVLHQCVVFLGLVLVAVCSLWMAVKLSEDLEHIRENHVPLLTVASYYMYSLPQIMHDLLPLTFLIAFLGTATVLERRNETTAMKACGISLTRAVAPLFALGLVLGLGLFFMDDNIVQRANRAEQRLYNAIRGREAGHGASATGYTWMFLPDGRTLVNFLEYDPESRSLIRPSVFVFDDRLNLRVRIMAKRATYTGRGWSADGAWSRTVRSDGTASFVVHPAPITLPTFNVDPSYFGREYRQPAQMSFSELREYITVLSSAGYRVDRLQVELHQRVAYPLSLVILAWLSLSFAFRVGRKSTLVGISVALAIGMAYFAALAFSTRLGEASLVPPVLAAWTPNVLFALWAANRHTTFRT